MPRDADDVRTRLLRKLTLKREQERQRVLDREQLRLEHIKETRDKINALDKSIGKGRVCCVTSRRFRRRFVLSRSPTGCRKTSVTLGVLP